VRHGNNGAQEKGTQDKGAQDRGAQDRNEGRGDEKQRAGARGDQKPGSRSERGAQAREGRMIVEPVSETNGASPNCRPLQESRRPGRMAPRKRARNAGAGDGGGAVAAAQPEARREPNSGRMNRPATTSWRQRRNPYPEKKFKPVRLLKKQLRRPGLDQRGQTRPQGAVRRPRRLCCQASLSGNTAGQQMRRHPEPQPPSRRARRPHLNRRH
jgi:hypothetical protein